NRAAAEQSLAELQADLTPDVFAAAVERGRARDLETTVRELIAEFSKADDDAAQQITGHAQADSLNERELEILRLIAEGLTNQEIAGQLIVSVNTVKWYAKEIYSKLHVSSRTQAVTRATALGLLR